MHYAMGITAITQALSASVCLAHQLRSMPHEPNVDPDNEAHTGLDTINEAVPEDAESLLNALEALARTYSGAALQLQLCHALRLMLAALHNSAHQRQLQQPWHTQSGALAHLELPSNWQRLLKGVAHGEAHHAPLLVLFILLDPACMGPEIAFKAAAVLSQLLSLRPTEMHRAGVLLPAHVRALPASAGLLVHGLHSHLLTSFVGLMASSGMVVSCIKLVKGETYLHGDWLYFKRGQL